jgi:hypothetical protein
MFQGPSQTHFSNSDDVELGPPPPRCPGGGVRHGVIAEIAIPVSDAEEAETGILAVAWQMPPDIYLAAAYRFLMLHLAYDDSSPLKQLRKSELTFW